MRTPKKYCIGSLLVLMTLFLGSGALHAQEPDVLSPAYKIQFPKKKIHIGKQTITVEMADNDIRRQRGLMFRERLEENQGMLFIFETEQPLSFWMKNTLIPLSIGYFDRDKKLIDIQEMVPAVVGEKKMKTYPSRSPAMYALEMSQGWFSRHKIEKGSTFSFAQ